MKLFRQTDHVTTNKDDKILIWSSKRNPLKNAVDLNTKMRKNYKVMSTNASTTKKRLRHAGLFGHRLAKYLMISRKKNYMARLKFSHRNWSDESFADCETCRWQYKGLRILLTYRSGFGTPSTSRGQHGPAQGRAEGAPTRKNCCKNEIADLKKKKRSLNKNSKGLFAAAQTENFIKLI
jgi:hypothetical protein